MKNSTYRFVAVGALFALLSSLRLPFLPEMQLLLLITLYVLSKGFSHKVACLLVCVLCTHHYAIPDVVYRFESSLYPSIYTKAYGSVKLFDLLTVFLIIIAVPRISSVTKVVLNKYLPTIVSVNLLLGMISVPLSRQNSSNLLFLIRSELLVLAVFLLCYRFTAKQLESLSILAVLCWIFKMIFAILLPADNPMYREVFGVQWNIFFAGDEYLTLGIYLCIILCLTRLDGSVRVSWLKLHVLVAFSLALALISQRKGAIFYFGVLWLVLWGEQRRSRLLYGLSNTTLFIMPWLQPIFLALIVPFLPALFRLMFLEYSELWGSALTSLMELSRSSLLSLLIGIGPAGMYEIFGLQPAFDHSTSFGREVGEVYRYAIWVVPYERLILNAGLTGFVIINLYILRNFRSFPSFYYLFLAVLPVFYAGNITPPSTLAIGLALIVVCRHVRAYKGVRVRKPRRICVPAHPELAA